eukprot:TRINITY_DN5737_c1_g1_i2.p1 TRINITY_DN5737_c1_g1~~TRINITY_DN5737_c1_g1_i2.p1  ORF type:complete len:410 (+),score=72.87 TRINITY_DN5737_c1_g1_i2:69-1232(+)
MAGSQWVCVTGATGFIAGHVIEQLLEAGYNVRATVRNSSDTNKYAHLTRLAQQYKQQTLEFVSADLGKPGSFDDAVKGCWGVCHVASPLGVHGTVDAQRELVEPAEQGTLNVLNACHKARVEKVVLTSSVATISNYSKTNKASFNGKIPTFTEKDDNQICSLNWHAYSYSKVRAEQAAWKYHDSLPKEEQFKLASIHPCLVLGPQQSTTVTGSNQLISLLLNGEYPLIPPLNFQSVDVRDVARAHVAVLESPDAHGRYLTTNSPKGGVWAADMAHILRKEFPDYPTPGIRMPVWMLRLASRFDARISEEFLVDLTTEGAAFDSSKIQKELGFKFKYDLEQTVRETASSMVQLGIAQRKKNSGNLKLWLGAVLFIALAATYYWWSHRN